MGSYSLSGLSGLEGTVSVGAITTTTSSVTYSYNFTNAQGTSVNIYSIASINYSRTIQITSSLVSAGADPVTITIPRTGGVGDFSTGEREVPRNSTTTISVTVNNPNFVYNTSTQRGSLTVTTAYRNNHIYLTKNFVTSADSVTGTYTVPEYAISIQSANTSQGTVSGYDPVLGNNFSDSRNIEYLITGVTITATPATGYKFKNWTVTGTNTVASTSSTFALPAITSAVGYTANFEPITFTLKYNSNGGTGNMSSISLKYTDSYTLPTSSFAGPKQTVTFNGNGATEPYTQTKQYSQIFNNEWLYVDSQGIQHTYSVGTNIANTFPVPDGSTIELKAIWSNFIQINDFENPIRQYHLFKGWLGVDGGLYFEGDTTPKVNYTWFKTVTAQWEKYQFRVFLMTDDSGQYKRIPYSFLKDKKIKRIIIYTPETGYKEI